MTKQEAILYLGLQESSWQDDLELKLFDLKKDFLRRVLIPKVILKKAEKVSVWYEAEQVLLGNDIVEISIAKIELPKLTEFTTENILKLFRVFEKELMRYQLALTQGNTAKSIAEALFAIGNLELNRRQRLLPLARQMFNKENWNTFEVKQSEDAQTGVIISELKQTNESVLETKKDLFLLPVFTRDLQRILKAT